MKEEPHKREAQKALASEVVRDLHKEEGLNAALSITQALFSGKLAELDESMRKDAIMNMEKINAQEGMTLLDLLTSTKIASSKREAREWIKGNSIALNGVKVTDPEQIITKKDAYIDNDLIVRRGKKRYYCIELG